MSDYFVIILWVIVRGQMDASSFALRRPHFILRLLLRFLADHGDHVVVTRSRSGNGGGLIMLGRSDGVLFV